MKAFNVFLAIAVTGILFAQNQQPAQRVQVQPPSSAVAVQPAQTFTICDEAKVCANLVLTAQDNTNLKKAWADDSTYTATGPVQNTAGEAAELASLLLQPQGLFAQLDRKYPSAAEAAAAKTVNDARAAAAKERQDHINALKVTK